jgi:phage tail protein X
MLGNNYLIHKTIDGDRWDLLAQAYYGNACILSPLLRANPNIAALPKLPSGIDVVVPIIPLTDTSPAPAPAVPWR